MRPYVLLSAAVSIDGFLDDASPERLMLSNAADFDRVDAVRAEQDAILVGAETIRRDDPLLEVKSEERRRRRQDRGQPPTPTKVTITRGGALDPGARFFTGEATKLVYTTGGQDGIHVKDLQGMLDDLGERGVERLMVEGGGRILTQFLTEGLAHELHLAIAPVFVGDQRAPRFVGDGAFPGPVTLKAATTIGDVALLRYHLPGRDRYWLRRAVELSRRCVPSRTAFSVGAVVLDADGAVLATGYSRETDDVAHAEEVALSRVKGQPHTVYSSMEPCGRRKSRPRTCAELILDAGVSRVVYAYGEPPVFVEATGAELLGRSGVDVVHLGELAPDVRKINEHLDG